MLDLPADDSDRPQPLATTFLLSDPGVRPAADDPARYTLHLKLLSLRQRRGIFDFRDHLEQTADFDDWLVVDIGAQAGALVAWATWNSQLSVLLRDYTATGEPLPDEDAAPGRWVKRPLPPAARAFLGEHAAVQPRSVTGRAPARKASAPGRIPPADSRPQTQVAVGELPPAEGRRRAAAGSRGLPNHEGGVEHLVGMLGVAASDGIDQEVPRHSPF